MDNFDNMEWEAPDFDCSAEMKKIRRSLRKRNALVVCTCLILVAALAFGMIRFGLPALEEQYWDPNTCSFVEGVPDLELTMNAYTELFHPQHELVFFDTVRTGFATYDITATFSRWTGNDTVANVFEDSKGATLSKGELDFPSGFWNLELDNPFNMKGAFDAHFTGTALASLKQYPEYVNVLAAVTFPEDMTMDELNPIRHTGDYFMVWCAVRTGEDYSSSYPACGFSNQGSKAYAKSFGYDSEYPALAGEFSSQTTETHFKSMLRYMQDQLDNGTGFLPDECRNENYYSDALNYVEENGVKVYGAYIIASSSALLTLYNDGTIDGISLCDAWINF